jgi:hypothetical protein
VSGPSFGQKERFLEKQSEIHQEAGEGDIIAYKSNGTTDWPADTSDAEQSERHKQDLLKKQKEGKGHWKPELASDSEEAVGFSILVAG